MSHLASRIFAATLTSVFAATVSSAPLQALGKGEGIVDIVAWPGYIERGDTDKNFDWVSGFEANTGCKVRVKTDRKSVV